MGWVSLGKFTITAGTPIQLTSTRTPAHAIKIQHAAHGNTGIIYLGTSNLSTSTLVGCVGLAGIHAASGVLPSVEGVIAIENNGLNVADFYIDGGHSGDIAIAAYLQA